MWYYIYLIGIMQIIYIGINTHRKQLNLTTCLQSDLLQKLTHPNLLVC